MRGSWGGPLGHLRPEGVAHIGQTSVGCFYRASFQLSGIVDTTTVDTIDTLEATRPLSKRPSKANSEAQSSSTIVQSPASHCAIVQSPASHCAGL
jgi:hypothetical protein